jgi:hypothetical protein
MAVDGESWESVTDGVYAGGMPESLSARRKKIIRCLTAHLPLLIKQHGAEEFGYIERLPLKALIASVLQDQDVTGLPALESWDAIMLGRWARFAAACRKERGESWENYHRRYMRMGTKHRASSNLWPVILSSFEEETLEDGWTRFHQYVHRGLRTCPAVCFPRGGAERDGSNP